MHSKTILIPISIVLLLLALVAVTVAAPLESASSTNLYTAPQDSTTLTAVADATVKSWQPNSNFGSDATLELSYSNIDVAQEALSLVQFDLSSLPAGAVIDSAQLQLYLDSAAGASTVDVGAYFVTGSWNENSVTWNTFPTANAIGINGSVDSSAGYKNWYITSYAQSWLDGTNNGLYLRGPTDGTYYGRTFKSREGRIYPPQLVITYHIACPTDSYEPNDSLGTAANATPGSAQQGYICPSNDDDYFKFSASNGQQMQIDLDGAAGGNLPADFDIELYDPDQGYVTHSTNGGTQTEQIIYTANQSGTWYIRIYGYNGAYSATDPYRLSITLSATATPTFTPTSPPAATDTPTPTSPPASTDTPTPTSPPAATDTPTPTSPPAATGTPTPTSPSTATGTPTPTSPSTATDTPTPTSPPMTTDTPTPTSPPAATNTPTRTPTSPPGATNTPTPTPSPTPSSCPDLLSNGDFETGDLPPWEHTGAVGLGAGRDSAFGTQLGGGDNVGGELWQFVHIPAGASPVTLNFWWRTENEAEQPDDTLEVIVQYGDDQADNLLRLSGAEARGEWQQATLNLDDYAGMEIALTFLVHTDAEVPTTFSLDDVNLQSCGGAVTWIFAGQLLLAATPDPVPAPPAVQVSLFGSHQPAELEQRLASGESAGEGLFQLIYTPAALQAQQNYEYLTLVVTDERYQVLDAWSESGGEQTDRNWLEFHQSPPGEYGGNIFLIQGTATATPTPTHTPTATPTNIIHLNLCAVADSTITDSDPVANLGAAPTLRVGYGAGQNEPFAYRSLLRFDLSFIPPGTQVQSATFEMRLIQADNPAFINVPLYELRDPWDEMTVTWQNQPPIATPFVTRIPVDASLGSVYAWDVKTLVQRWIDNEPQNLGLEVRGPEGGTPWTRLFDSRHYTPFCPRLSLQLRPSEPIPTPTSTPPPTATPTPTPACTHPDAGNSFAQATALTPDGSWNYEYICPSGDVDWWQFPADDHQEITIYLGGMPQAPPADYDLFLIDPSGGQIASSELWGASKDEYINITVYQKGDYRVLVRGKGVADWSNKTPYQLSVETKYVCSDPNDAGDTWSAAAPISPSLPQANISHVTYGYICPQGDVDWYRFHVPGGQNVLIWAKLTELPADYNLALYEPSGQLLGQSNNAGTADENVLYAALNQRGVYLVRVQGATTSSYHAQAYKLEVSLSGTADLFVQNIEVTQAIQDLNNNVPLVSGKPTIARVYVGASGIVHGPISDVSVTLRGWTAGWNPQPLGTLVLGPSARPNGVLNDAKRINYNSSYNFVLPKSWLTGTALRLEAEVNAPLTVPETTITDNKLTVNNISERTTAALNVGLVPVRASKLTPSLQNNTQLTNMIAYLRAVFPAARINIWHKKGGPLNADYNYIGPASDGSCGDGWNDLLDDLEDIYDHWKDRPAHAFVYGLLHPNVPSGSVIGCGRMGNPYSSGKLNADSGPTIAHEMGHNFGRWHAPCGGPHPSSIDSNYPTYTNAQGTPYPSASIGQVGLNVVTHQTFSPNTAKDLMSYCGPKWFSPYNYTAILNRIPATAAAATVTQESPHITISGDIKDGQVELPRPFWMLERKEGAYNDPGEGSYSIILKDASGTTLFERHFDVITEVFASDHNPGHFHEIMPFPPETVAIVFTHEGQVLRTVPVSAHAPTVQVLSPNGGENWPDAGPYTIRWQASDEDGDELTARVLYSADGGATWEPLAVNLKGAEFQVEAGDLPGGDDNLVRVLVSDGVNTSHDDSDAPFTVSDKAPLALIIQPSPGAILYPEQPVILQGVTSDPEEGPLPDEQMQWTSDRDGALGQGADLAVPALSAGVHRLTLSASDSKGHTGETTITVIVGRSPYLPLVMQN